MPNKSMFLKAAEATPDAVEKLASLAVKRADLMHIYNRAPTIDPLDNPEFGPARSGDSVRRGKHIGALAGALGGAALGGVAGHSIGSAIGGAPNELGQSITHHLMGHYGDNPNHVDGSDDGQPSTVLDKDQAIDHDTIFHHTGGNIGGVAGAVAGGFAGHALGKRIGGGIGSLTSPEAQAAEKIKRMDPASGLAHIRMLEQSGRVSPSVIQAMKDSYNTRRTGLQTQIQSGVALPPGERAQDIGTPSRRVLV